MRELVFISLEAWDDVWRRNQFVCDELARRHPARTILFVTPSRDLSNAVRLREWERLRRTSSWSPAGLPNVVVFTPTKSLPNTLAIGRVVNGASLRRQVLAEMRRIGLERPLLWVNDHAAGHLVGRLGEAGVAYDVTDDWISFDQPNALRERTRAQDAELCRRADATIVCSQRLLDMKRSLVPKPSRLHLIPNGVHVEHYATVRDRTLPIPAVAKTRPRPVFGYVGTVHPDRVDVTLVEQVARGLTAGSIALVGPNHLAADDRRRLEATGRVFMTGPVPHASVPDYMRAFDVCIVPHRMTPFTESLNPIKLFEYLAAGKPIVSTDVAGFRDYPQFVRLARDAASFAAALAIAQIEPGEVADLRRAEAAKHSWSSRVDAIEAVIDAIGSEREMTSSARSGAVHAA